jgi:hypothetical protein
MALNQHATLLCSLPRLPADFEQPHVPLSWPRMENRLRMLDADEVRLLATLGAFWRWELARPDHDPVRLYEELLALGQDDDGLLECVETLADIRMLTVAVRAKAMDRTVAAAVGRWGAHVLRHWQLPEFGLGLRFPWLAEYGHHLENRQYAQAERTACRVIWQQMAAIADRHYFDLVAIIAYLVRWDLISRWAARDSEAGRDRFHTLVKEALGDYAG